MRCTNLVRNSDLLKTILRTSSRPMSAASPLRHFQTYSNKSCRILRMKAVRRQLPLQHQSNMNITWQRHLQSRRWASLKKRALIPLARDLLLSKTLSSLTILQSLLLRLTPLFSWLIRTSRQIRSLFSITEIQMLSAKPLITVTSLVTKSCFHLREAIFPMLLSTTSPRAASVLSICNLHNNKRLRKIEKTRRWKQMAHLKFLSKVWTFWRR